MNQRRGRQEQADDSQGHQPKPSSRVLAQDLSKWAVGEVKRMAARPWVRGRLARRLDPTGQEGDRGRLTPPPPGGPMKKVRSPVTAPNWRRRMRSPPSLQKRAKAKIELTHTNTRSGNTVSLRQRRVIANRQCQPPRRRQGRSPMPLSSQIGTCDPWWPGPGSG